MSSECTLSKAEKTKWKNKYKVWRAFHPEKGEWCVICRYRTKPCPEKKLRFYPQTEEIKIVDMSKERNWTSLCLEWLRSKEDEK
jgi:hypothetical protein